MESDLRIVVNGQLRQVAPGTTVADLLDELGVTAQYCAVEVNLQLVPRAKHAQHRLSPGDRLEVVTLVGGG